MDSLFTISKIPKLQELFIITEETFVTSTDTVNYVKLLKLLPSYNTSKTSYYIYENNNLIIYEVNKKWFRNQYVIRENICYNVKIKNIFENLSLLGLINQYLISNNFNLKYEIRKLVIPLEYLQK